MRNSSSSGSGLGYHLPSVGTGKTNLFPFWFKTLAFERAGRETSAFDLYRKQNQLKSCPVRIFSPPANPSQFASVSV